MKIIETQHKMDGIKIVFIKSIVNEKKKYYAQICCENIKKI
jgi:hypothetical protein